MPSSLEQCRRTCERFLRETLPSFRAVEATLPTIPQFSVKQELKRDRARFVEHGGANWWQVSKTEWAEAFNTDIGRTFLKSLESTAPFNKAIGKSLWVVERARGSSFNSAKDLAREILTS